MEPAGRGRGQLGKPPAWSWTCKSLAPPQPRAQITEQGPGGGDRVERRRAYPQTGTSVTGRRSHSLNSAWIPDPREQPGLLTVPSQLLLCLLPGSVQYLLPTYLLPLYSTGSLFKINSPHAPPLFPTTPPPHSLTPLLPHRHIQVGHE